MNLDQATDLIRESLTVMLVLSAPILAAALLIGLAVSMLQAVTQIHEQTLAFVPKVIGMAMVVIFIAPWMMRVMLEFATRIFGGG